MLKKSYRLRKNWHFQEVIKKSQDKKIFSHYFSVFSIKNNLKTCQFGISIPQRIVKKAVDRNLFKRQVRDMLRSYLKQNNDICQKDKNYFHRNFVIIIRNYYLNNDFQTNKNNLHKLLFLTYQK